MGRSEVDSGTYHYKKQWGASPISLEYSTYSASGSQLLSSVDLYHSSGARALARVWRKLPSALIEVLGPRVRKFLP
jgi:serine/alanine adding enzyme